MTCLNALETLASTYKLKPEQIEQAIRAYVRNTKSKRDWAKKQKTIRALDPILQEEWRADKRLYQKLRRQRLEDELKGNEND